MRAIPIGFLLLAAAAAMSCGESTVDAVKAEGIIRRAVAEQLQSRVAAVTCPEDVEEKQGATFTCVVTGADGSKGTATATQRENGGLSVNAPFLNVRQAEGVMARQIGRRSGRDGVRVSCPEIVVDRAGRRFTCNATAANRFAGFSVRLTDGDGHFTYRPPKLG
jgi:Domain of unknown function (DUF4333)